MGETQSRGERQRILSLSLLFSLLLLGLLATRAAFAGVPAGSVDAIRAPEQGTPTPTAAGTVTATPVCPSGWTSYPNPAPQGESTLHAVKAFSPSDMWAVGEYGTNTPRQTLMVHGNGTQWSQVSSPNPVAATQLSLLSVDGIAPNDVWAVGYYNYNYTLIEHWNGTSWSIVPSPSIYTYDRLYAVSAIASNDVWAIGTYDYGQTWPLLEHWNGTSWSVAPDPSCPVCSGRSVYGVTAVASNDVWAVGTTIMHWDGTQWSYVLGNGGWLTAVEAVAANNIWAVGYSVDPYSHYSTLVMHFDGSTWSNVPSPNPGATTNHFYGMSVRAANDVWAVGDTDQAGGGTKVLAEHWDGSAWSVVSTPDNTTGGDHFYGVAAPVGGVEWAVGASGCISGCNHSALIARYGPQCVPPTPTPPPCGLAWRTVLSPSPGAHSELYGVAVVAANDIWAVGASSNTGGRMIEHWDGTSWSVVPSADVPNRSVPNRSVPAQARYEGLYGISAVSANDIWAVGFGAFIEHWDGTSWSAVPSPGGDTLNGVVAVASNDVWAVGSAAGGLIMHWDGTQWSIVPSPSPVGSYLSSVAAVSANDVWAVGEQGSPWQMMSEHWDGTQWSLVSIPTPGAEYNKMRGVAAVATNDVWAVGDYSDCWDCPELTVTEHWNGTQWSIVPSPSPGAGDNELWGVTVVGGASNNIWAVGEFWPAPDDTTLIEHWDGSSWSVRSQGPAGVLFGVASVASSDVWTVGYRPGTSNDITLTERYNDPCGGATVTPTSGTTSSPTRTPTSPAASSPTSSPTRTATASITPTGTATGTATRTNTPHPTNTPSPSFTPGEPTGTHTATPISTSTSTATSTACPVQFTDVPNGSTFYAYIRCLACRGIVNGYGDGTFRPNNNVTRGQLSKIVSNSAGFSDPQTTQMFQDVPPGSTFVDYIGRLASRGYINGYDCGGPGEPCVPPANLPYFRTNNNATRGQITKIVSNAAGLNDPPAGQIFEDVPPGSTFFTYTQRLASRGVMQGYQCGGAGQPCVPPDNRPYFRPLNNATRGQTSKIVANTFIPGCVTPSVVRR